ncbi:alcohol dehydrogenase 2-like [Melanaphis sacchari]|uniref:alcohol dehydrogenase 2-like n=1 Tax=Melanaphis sacchari TaxID=742174 RepID=UPI000DC14BB2|nr:alcohol dehydrogenase 2-like [Melanaphis sacchari]
MSVSHEPWRNRRFPHIHDHKQRLLSESYQHGCPDHSNFRSISRNARKNCTIASSSSSSCPDKVMDIEGKCALVVDGTSGVGFAFADELLKMKASKVVITGLDAYKGTETASKLNKRYGPARVDFYQADISNPLEFENMFKYIKNNFEALDIFFNNAEIHKGKDVITTNFVSNIQGITLACKNMKGGSVIVNHTSALGLDPDSDMVAQSAASAGFMVTSTAFGKNKYFEKTQIRMMTLCSELQIPSMCFEGMRPYKRYELEEYKNIQILIAKSASYLVKYGPKNTLWLCQRSGVLSMVELQTLNQFIEKYEPSIAVEKS